jgi:hypothetical protein
VSLKAGSLGRNSFNRSRGERFGFHGAARAHLARRLAGAKRPLAGTGGDPPRLIRGLVRGVKGVVRPSDGIVDEDHLLRATSGGQGAEACQRLLAASAAVTIAHQVHRRGLADTIAIGEGLRAFRDEVSGEGSAFYDTAGHASLCAQEARAGAKAGTAGRRILGPDQGCGRQQESEISVDLHFLLR